MKILVTGGCGQLGYDIMNELTKRKHEGICSDIFPYYCGTTDDLSISRFSYIPLDITDISSVSDTVEQITPDAIIHCAAWNAVDAAEKIKNIEKVRMINVVGTENIAKVCKRLNCKMMYISTDYVFDGRGTDPWKPDCKEYHPLSVYGLTKLEGELAVSMELSRFFIVRTSWAFGRNGKNFVRTILNAGKTHNKLKVVYDQIGTPTYTFDLARLLVDMIESEKYGYYHATNEGGYISWYDFAKEIFRQAVEFGHIEFAEENLNVIPVTTSEYGISKAVRPFNSRLDKTKLIENGFAALPTWQDALKRYLNIILEIRSDRNGTD